MGRQGCEHNITLTTTARTYETRTETRFACAVMVHLKRRLTRAIDRLFAHSRRLEST